MDTCKDACTVLASHGQAHVQVQPVVHAPAPEKRGVLGLLASAEMTRQVWHGLSVLSPCELELATNFFNLGKSSRNRARSLAPEPPDSSGGGTTWCTSSCSRRRFLPLTGAYLVFIQPGAREERSACTYTGFRLWTPFPPSLLPFPLPLTPSSLQFKRLFA